ncbi:hypothetical protein D3C76_982970 [compost metagenome]
MAQQCWRRRDVGPVECLGLPAHQRLEQRHDALLAAAQWGQLEADDVQAKIKVPAKFATFDHFSQRALGGGDHPHVHRDVLGRAQALDRPGFQDPQQFGLQSQRHAVDFVQVQRAVMRGFDEPRAILAGPGKRAGVGPEKLALGEGFGNGGAVDGNELAGAAGHAMDLFCQRVFTGTRLAAQQHVDHQRSDALDERLKVEGVFFIGIGKCSA